MMLILIFTIMWCATCTKDAILNNSDISISRKAKAADEGINDLTCKSNSSMFVAFSEEVKFCLPWHYCEEGQCQCGMIPHGILKCDLKHIATLDRHCITYNEEEELFEAGSCIFNINQKGDYNNLVYRSISTNISEINRLMCTDVYNRNGTLCGRCKAGFFPIAYSFNMTCIECLHGKSDWWKYVLAAYLPLTLFCFFVLLCKINITSSHLHGFVYFSQIASMPVMARNVFISSRDMPNFLSVAKFVCSIFGMWNLDFLRFVDLGICLETNTLQALSLDLAMGIYPLLLLVLSYLLIHLYDRRIKLFVTIWKPFHNFFGFFRANWEIKTSIIDAFATFFLLSSVKFLSVSFDLLVPVTVYHLNSTGDLSHSTRLYYDANVLYFGERHLPYAILAISVLLLFVILPAMLLCLYPFNWFQKCLNMFPVRWYVMHTFIDSFHGYFKDGTEPDSCDCRWFAAFFFLARFFLFVAAALTLDVMFFVIGSMCLVVFIIVLVILEPFKKNVVCQLKINTSFMLFLCMIFVSFVGVHIAEASGSNFTTSFFVFAVIISLISLLYIPGIFIYRIRYREIVMELRSRIRAWRHGYTTIA